MSALTPLCALLAASLASGALLLCVQRGVAAGWRRELLLAALVAPLASLPFAWPGPVFCSGSAMWTPCATTLRHTSAFVASALVVLITFAAVSHTALRVALLNRRITRLAFPADDRLQNVVERLASRYSLPAPQVLMLDAAAPLAFTVGAWRPVIALSLWVVEALDAEELEAVLAHELSHVARRDYLLMLIATTLRNTFFYLPQSHIAYHLLAEEKERACDDLAIGGSARPLALASALTKVWRSATEAQVTRMQGSWSSASQGLGQALTASGANLEERVVRLLAADAQPPTPPCSRVRGRTLPFSLSALVAVVGVNSLLIGLALTMMGCFKGI